MTKRDLFAELMEGFDALEAAREGRTTLKQHVADADGDGTLINEGTIPQNEKPR